MTNPARYYVAHNPEMTLAWEIRLPCNRGGYYQLHACATKAEAYRLAVSWNEAR